MQSVENVPLCYNFKMTRKILLSGVKPTGTPHLGNYFGAMKQFVDLQKEDYEIFIMIADLHALTSVHNREELKNNIDNLLLDYLAIGLDTDKVTIFKQSAVPAHAELTWIFNCLTTMPELMRAHSFKDAEAKNKDINVGVFDYPILMSADILLYDTDVVPVGRDQEQHLEIARDTARTFNNLYCQDGEQIFIEPKALILNDVAVVPGTDGQKMSKSYKNVVPLFATDEEWQKSIMSIVTDSKSPNESKDPETCNIFALHKLVTPADKLEEIRKRYVEGGIGYKESKDLLLESIKNYFGEMRDRRNQLEKNLEYAHDILRTGSIKALERANQKMQIIREKVGLN